MAMRLRYNRSVIEFIGWESNLSEKRKRRNCTMKILKPRAYVQPDLSVLPMQCDVLTGSGDVAITVKMDGDYVLADIYGNDTW